MQKFKLILFSYLLQHQKEGGGGEFSGGDGKVAR